MSMTLRCAQSLCDVSDRFGRRSSCELLVSIILSLPALRWSITSSTRRLRVSNYSAMDALYTQLLSLTTEPEGARDRINHTRSESPLCLEQQHASSMRYMSARANRRELEAYIRQRGLKDTNNIANGMKGDLFINCRTLLLKSVPYTGPLHRFQVLTPSAGMLERLGSSKC